MLDDKNFIDNLKSFIDNLKRSIKRLIKRVNDFFQGRKKVIKRKNNGIDKVSLMNSFPDHLIQVYSKALNHQFSDDKDIFFQIYEVAKKRTYEKVMKIMDDPELEASEKVEKLKEICSEDEVYIGNVEIDPKYKVLSGTDFIFLQLAAQKHGLSYRKPVIELVKEIAECSYKEGRDYVKEIICPRLEYLEEYDVDVEYVFEKIKSALKLVM